MRSPRKQPVGSTKAPKARFHLPWRDLLDVLALGAWSAMLFRYWFSGLLLLLLHPNYAWLSNSAAIVLAALAAYRLWQAFQSSKASRRRVNADKSSDNSGHVTLLPGNLSSAILLTVAVFGLIYTPQAFASQTATQRGIADTLTLTRAQPQRFARAAAPEDRTIIDWIRLINVYPEPDAYTDEAVDVEGFVIYTEGWPDGYLMLSRFVLTCCAADAYPVGLPVKLPEDSTVQQFPVDTWLSVSGRVATETLNGQRQIAIAPTEIQTIEAPKNPYEY